eukprot:c5929_g1_i1.p1 GENE.c5929_g1_i1~~c5929_g1_i1.p1  ORF type:complete len:498 (-),score=124.11 c5929_g1_i1:21-1382(-)
MTAYSMELILKGWINPFVDTKNWEFYDMSCRNRDATNDKVLHDVVDAGNRIGSIFKEPTITPSLAQKEAMGLKKLWGSPNGAMRRGWNGITISRDTIHIEGIRLGFSKPVFFERHAVGGEYGAGWATVGKGRLMTTFFPDDPDAPPKIVDARTLTDEVNSAVVYHNPLDNVEDLAHHFFSRCLTHHIVPYVVTKKTVFKWQEGFWQIMKNVFDKHYKEKFIAAGLLKGCDNELKHLISDSATMQIIRWTNGGFGMAAHNYDGDMLTDEVAQVHRSPGFLTSNLIGKRADGTLIKEFEASHGTVADLWLDHLRGKETSFNPLGLATALIDAMQWSAELHGHNEEMNHFTTTLRKAIHHTFRYDRGTRDMSGPTGYTTEQFVDRVAWRLERYLNGTLNPNEPIAEENLNKPTTGVDTDAVLTMFREADHDGNGHIDLQEFTALLVKLNVAPKKTN